MARAVHTLAELLAPMGMIRQLREFSRWHIEKHLLSLLVRPDQGVAQATHVADTLLPAGLVRPEWICYCAGVGEDIRIEQFLAESRGAQVWAFDPTPRAITYMRNTPHDSRTLHFLPVGLWNEDTTLRFHAPANPAHVSHSVMEPLGGGDYFDAPCRSITSIMEELGHDHIDLLKMNIEGAEHVVLESLLSTNVRPRVLTFTCEGDGAMLKAREWAVRLRREGYQLLGRVDWFFTFVRSEGSARA